MAKPWKYYFGDFLTKMGCGIISGGFVAIMFKLFEYPAGAFLDKLSYLGLALQMGGAICLIIGESLIIKYDYDIFITPS